MSHAITSTLRAPSTPNQVSWIGSARLAWAYSQRIYGLEQQSHSGKPRSGFKRHVRWSLMALLCPGWSRLWFQEVEGGPMRPFVEVNPRLAFRPMASYLSKNLAWQDRVRIIRDTYRFVATDPALRQAMSSMDGMEWARIQLELGTLLIRLQPSTRFRKEGEITVSLSLDEPDRILSSFSFSIEAMEGGQAWAMRIGAVQGHAIGSDQVRELTKQMHGLRPKSLMVLLAQELAFRLGLERLFGISGSTHLYASKAGFKGMTFDYDELWLEHDGTPCADGWHQLPGRWQPRAPQEIKPNKRSQYAKRYRLIAQIQQAMQGDALAAAAMECA